MKQRFVIPVLSSSVSYAVALLLAIAVPQWHWPGIYVYVISFVGVVTATIYATAVEKKHIDELEKVAKNIGARFEETHKEYVRDNQNLSELIVKSELERVATALVPTANKALRANVFLPDPTDHMLCIVYHYGMENAPDLTIRLATNAGCAGHAFHFGEIAVATLVDQADKQLRVEWKLEDVQIAATRHLRSIIAVPIRHPIKTNQIIGVLNLDSIYDLSQTFQGSDFQKQVQYAAFLIAAFLWLGNVVKR